MQLSLVDARREIKKKKAKKEKEAKEGHRSGTWRTGTRGRAMNSVKSR